MRLQLLLASAVIVLAPLAASAQPAAAPTAAVASTGHYTTAETEIGTLLDDPAAKAIIDKHVPGFSANDQVDMARGMSLQAVQQYAPDMLTDKTLAAIDADFAKLPAKK